MDSKLKELVIKLYLAARDEHDYYKHINEIPRHLRDLETEATQKRRTTIASNNLEKYLSKFDISEQDKRNIIRLRRDLSSLVKIALEDFPEPSVFSVELAEEDAIEGRQRLVYRLSKRIVKNNPEYVRKSPDDIRREKRQHYEQMILEASLPSKVYQDHPYFPPVGSQPHETFDVYTNVTLSGDYTRMAKKDIRSHSSAKNDYISITINYPNYTKDGKWHRYAGKVYKRAKINKPKSFQEIIDKFNKICSELYLFPVN